MTAATITTREDLHRYLHAALQLEHATLPPYLTALYSIHPSSNSDAFHILRVVAVEEMLHLTLVANVLNAVGGTPDLTVSGFVPIYPAHLPDGEDDFAVGLGPLSQDTLDTFCKIERPSKAPDEDSRLVRSNTGFEMLAASPTAPGMHFYSIGEFYAEIDRGLCLLNGQPGEQLFCGDPARQIMPEYFYSGGGEIIPVTDLASARAALRLIAEQGEGYGGGIYDDATELAHYYRFQQMKLGRYYQQGDQPDKPTGPSLAVDWDAVYPVKISARVADYPEGSELLAAAREFNDAYAAFLGVLTCAFTGTPKLLVEAVWDMLRLRDQITRLIHNPINGTDGLHAAPTFEVTGAPEAAS